MYRWVSIFLVSLFGGVGVFAQTADDVINFDELNIPYLEHLLKKEVDYIKTQKKQAPFRNDSILYLAARNQTEFMLRNNELTHFQKENKAFEDPQLRIEYYGAQRVFAGENVLYFPTSIPVQVKYQKFLEEPKTYLEYARVLAKGWRYSKPHYANIISPDYSITGVCVRYDKEQGQLWATQVFGQVMGEYNYTENCSLFPYSTTDQKKKRNKEAVILSFQKKYAFGLKAPTEQSHCPDYLNDKWASVELKLNITQDQMLLCVYDLNTFSRFFNYSKDGLAVELVGFHETFDCKKELELQPNVHNGYGLLTGSLYKPLYRNNILDQVYELEQINRSRPKRRGEQVCNYIDLGPTPIEFKRIPHEASVFYLHKKRLCTKIKTYGYCGELIQYKPSALPYKLDLPTFHYVPKDDFTWLEFQIQYKRNQVLPNSGEVDRVKNELESKEYIILGIEIEAYASIEGTKEDNERIFNERASQIIKELEEIHQKEIPFSVKTNENWQMFYDQMKSSADFKELSKLSESEARKQVNQLLKSDSTIEGYLQHERYARVRIKISPKPSTNWNLYRAFRELEDLRKEDEPDFEKINNLYGYLLKNRTYAHYEVRAGINAMSFENRDELAISRYRKLMAQLIEDTEYQDGEIIESRLSGFSKLLNLPEIDYNLKATMANFPEAYSEKDRITLAKSLLKQLEAEGGEKELIDDISLWYHFEMASLVFHSQYGIDIEKAEPSLEFIHDYYSKNSPEDDFKLQLSQFYLAFEKIEWASELLLPMIETANPSIPAYELYLKNCTQEEREKFPARFALRLREAYDVIGERRWCNLFIGDCKIPMTSFYNPTLRSTYCQTCQQFIYRPEKE